MELHFDGKNYGFISWNKQFISRRPNILVLTISTYNSINDSIAEMTNNENWCRKKYIGLRDEKLKVETGNGQSIIWVRI